MIDSLITQIETELTNQKNGYVERVEDLLGQVATLNDPDCIGKLLPFFEDDAEYDELMFSIIHSIENFDDATYVREIGNHLGDFFGHSPRWAVIVHMRILNSAPTLTAYSEQIKSLTDQERLTVRNVLQAVRQKDAKFYSACDSLIATL
ncbi:Imm30 family immunity protein [Thalassoglobus sp. JC818]|uniref:Imm30 family immunity protein n=1 Tax=Thalassoglobus sp. JC818 TaxID=3232136 RepID=UPI00345919AD